MLFRAGHCLPASNPSEISSKVQDAAKARDIRTHATKKPLKHLEFIKVLLHTLGSIRDLPGVSSYNRKLSEQDSVLLELSNRHVHGTSIKVKLSAEQEGGVCKAMTIYIADL